MYYLNSVQNLGQIFQILTKKLEMFQTFSEQGQLD